MIRLLLRKQVPRCFSTNRIVSEDEWNELHRKIDKINMKLNDAIEEIRCSHCQQKFTLTVTAKWKGVTVLFFFTLSSIVFGVWYFLGDKMENECSVLSEQISECKEELEKLEKLERENKDLINSLENILKPNKLK